MDLTCPADNKVREITGDIVRNAVRMGLTKEAIAESIREDIRRQLNRDSFVEGLVINTKEQEFTALIGIEGRKGAILIADDLENTCPMDNRVREITHDSVIEALKNRANKEEIIQIIQRNIKYALNKECIVEGLNVNMEDNEFTALIVVPGRRGAIAVSSSIF